MEKGEKETVTVDFDIMFVIWERMEEGDRKNRLGQTLRASPYYTRQRELHEMADMPLIDGPGPAREGNPTDGLARNRVLQLEISGRSPIGEGTHVEVQISNSQVLGKQQQHASVTEWRHHVMAPPILSDALNAHNYSEGVEIDGHHRTVQDNVRVDWASRTKSTRWADMVDDEPEEEPMESPPITNILRNPNSVNPTLPLSQAARDYNNTGHPKQMEHIQKEVGPQDEFRRCLMPYLALPPTPLSHP